MTEAELIAKWEPRAAEYEQVGAQVSGATLCRTFLQDLACVRTANEYRVLSLAEAAACSRYSAAHLARLVKQGKLRTLRPPESRGRLSFRRGTYRASRARRILSVRVYTSSPAAS